MQRRDFLKGLLLTAAGLAVPPVALAAPVRRLWALDGTMLGGGARIATAETMSEAEAFSANAGRVMALLKKNMDALYPLAEFRAPDAETVEDFAGAWREYSYPFKAVVIYDEDNDYYLPQWVEREPRGGMQRAATRCMRRVRSRSP